MNASGATTNDLELRSAEDHELPAAIQLCGESLGWSADDPNEAFFRWKHLDNPFGRSGIWLAVDDDAIVGVRAFMRWQLAAADRPTLTMVRAVDTATAPSHQGRGIFTRLTTAAADELTELGVDAVFNTPNDKSRPGYLKMGWTQVGRVPVSFRPRTPAAIAAMVTSKTSADKWGIPTDVGADPAEALASTDLVEALVASLPRTSERHTPISADYLRWRTAFEPLQCRVLPLGPSIADGCIVFRLRERGNLTQLSILEAVAPEGSRALIRKGIRHLLKATTADVALATTAGTGLATGMLPLPRTGPILTWRTLANPATPALGDLALSMGSIELF